MDTVLRPQSLGGIIIVAIGLALWMMTQVVSQVNVDVQAQPRQQSRQIFTAVVADDLPLEQAKTVVAVEVVLRALGYEPRVLPAITAAQTIEFALTGNNDGQANAVFLDGGYTAAGGNVMDWLIPDPSGYDDFARGNTLAAFLRASGYTGPIILTSTFPDDYLDEPGGENFALGLKKADFWGNPRVFVEAIRVILK